MAQLSPDTPIAVIGAGAMGAGIAQVAAAAGHRVLLQDVREGAAEAAIKGLDAGLARLVERGKMTAQARAALVARITPIATLGEAAGAGLAVEAVKEDLEVKRALFAELEAVMGEEAILATNTSSLSITAIAAGLKRPERLAGLHFFNPAQVMPLVEVVTGLATDPAVAEALLATARAWGKHPVLARSTPGFIVNRVARPFYGEALRLLQEGAADPATLDALVRDGFGFRMGPFELMDLIGLDVSFAATSSIHAAYFGDPRYAPSVLQRERVEAGWLGRKTGRGFYDYTEAAAKPEPKTLAGGEVGGVAVQGDLGPAEGLVARLEAAGVAVRREAGPGRLVVPGATLALGDGRTAAARAASDVVADLVLFDLLDFAAGRRIALSRAPYTSPSALAAAAGLFRAAGIEASEVTDLPGLVCLRTVAMLANEASEAVLHGVASAADVDTAMLKGVNYPAGPLALADRIGPAFLVRALDNLAGAYGEDRYRASILMRRLAASGQGFHA
jgi:3-hydroxybutyryl-CoA dehydrogenase